MSDLQIHTGAPDCFILGVDEPDVDRSLLLLF
jgi:hypothetical protein